MFQMLVSLLAWLESSIPLPLFLRAFSFRIVFLLA